MITASRHRFGEFVLDIANRSLLRAGEPVALNSRYFNALVLLVLEQGRLVGKQRFFDEVWAGSVVTDAALTQCVKEIRRALGDDAGDPRYVRTVPGHGYCFIADVSQDDIARPHPEAVVEGSDGVASDLSTAPLDVPAGTPVVIEEVTADRVRIAPAVPRWLADGVAATVGGAMAGLVGGVLYGSALAVSPQAQGLGTLSVLLVLLALSVTVGMVGALGVGLGIVGGRQIGDGAGWTLAGGAVGGFMVGGLVKLLGSDAFTLLVGHAPIGITGGLEGAAIGFAVAAGLRLAGGADGTRPARSAAFGALTTGLAGAAIPLLGGSLMATSLARVAAAFDRSRLDMAPLGRWFGEPQFGTVAQAALGALEGAIFGACVVAALVASRLVSRR